jgi:hypothetical protein
MDMAKSQQVEEEVAKPEIPKNKLAVVEQRVGRTRKVQVLEFNIDNIHYLQVCMAGAKLGNTHRQGSRELGVILPRKEIDGITDFTLIRRLEQLRLKPRTKADYELQQEYGIDAVPWKAPVGAKFQAPEEVELQPGHNVPESVRIGLNLSKEQIEEEGEEEEPQALPNFNKMKREQIHQFMEANEIEYAGSDTKKILIKRINDWYNEDTD